MTVGRVGSPYSQSIPGRAVTVTKTVIVSAGHTALAARTALPFARSFPAKMSGVMNGAKGGHGRPDGRTTRRRGRRANPLLSLHCVLRWRYLPFYKSAPRSPAARPAGTPVSMALYAARQCPPPPPRHMSSPPVSFGSVKCEETIEFVIVTRQTEERRRRRRRRRTASPPPRISQSGRRRARAREWVAGAWPPARPGWRPAAAAATTTKTHGAEYWGGLHFSADFTRRGRGRRGRNTFA